MKLNYVQWAGIVLIVLGVAWYIYHHYLQAAAK